MTVEQDVLEAFRKLQENVQVINEYFAKEYSIKEAIGYEMNALIAKKQAIVNEVELVKEQLKLVKAKGEEIEKEIKERCKVAEDKSRMRLIDVENEKARMETEIVKMKEEKYNLARV